MFNGKTWIIQIIISALLVLVSVFATANYQTTSAEKKFVTRSEYEVLVRMVSDLKADNKQDHREIQACLQKLMHEVGGLQGGMRQN